MFQTPDVVSYRLEPSRADLRPIPRYLLEQPLVGDRRTNPKAVAKRRAQNRIARQSRKRNG